MPDAPSAQTRWRCAACGNLTRFDVVRTLRLREYVHADLGGEPVVEESETLGETIEHVTCRWCGAVDQVDLVPRPASADPLSTAPGALSTASSSTDEGPLSTVAPPGTVSPPSGADASPEPLSPGPAPDAPSPGARPDDRP